MKNNFFSCLLCFFLPALLSAVGPFDAVLNSGPGVVGELAIGRREFLHDFIEQIEREKVGLQGGVIAILDRGQVVYQTVFGHKEGVNGEVTSKTFFSVASVSKLTSATAIALQVNAGVLDFDKTYKLPWLAKPISLCHLLSHTTGYDFTNGDALIESGMSREHILAKLARSGPIAAPGSHYRYSNMIFSLVDDVLVREDTSLRESIDWLGAVLQTDGIRLAPLPTDIDIAYPHRADIEGGATATLPLSPYYPYAAPAAAGIYANLEGLIELFKLRFGYRPDLISQTVLDRLNSRVTRAPDFKKWNSHWPIPKRFIRSYYGLGCRILRSIKHPGQDLIYHTGFLNGMGAFVGFIPAKQVGIIIVLNQHSRVTTTAAQMGLEFWGLFLKQAGNVTCSGKTC